MTEKTQPTDAEIAACIDAAQVKCVHPDAETTIEIARAVLAKWGTPPAVAGEPFCYVSVNKQGDITRTMKRKDKWTNIPLYTTPQPTQAQAVVPVWTPASTPPKEEDGEVLVRMADGRCEIAWATYWHGSCNAFAQWTFRDPDEDEQPVEWMHIPKHCATAPQPVACGPLTDEQAASLCKIGPVYAPDGQVVRTPEQYRRELEGAKLAGIRTAERAHGIKGGQHVGNVD